MGDVVKEACGLFGVYGHKDAAHLTYVGLQALQHRGQESCGIVASDGEIMRERLRMGLVATNFTRDNFEHGNRHSLEGHIATGHVRYSTTGSSTIRNCQPLVLDTKYGKITIAHNGNLTNGLSLREDLKSRGAIFKSTTDSEVIGHLIAHSLAHSIDLAIADALQQIDGAYSLVITTKDALYAARDPHGFRPLSIGQFDAAIVVASETCAFDAIKSELNCDVNPGELIRVDSRTITKGKGYSSHWFVPEKVNTAAFCLFELVYFARPDSVINGISVAQVRRKLGRELARQHPVAADLVCPVLDSGLYAALGYSEESGISFVPAYVRNHYVGRTFITPTQADRVVQINQKLNLIRELVDGKKVVVVDDSIVRGNTAKSRVSELKACGAREVHMRVSCPPHVSPCFYGIDFPDRLDLIAANHTPKEICSIIGADSLGYLSLEGLLSAPGSLAQGYCTACWTGTYPTSLEDLEQGLLGKKC